MKTATSGSETLHQVEDKTRGKASSLESCTHEIRRQKDRTRRCSQLELAMLSTKSTSHQGTQDQV